MKNKIIYIGLLMGIVICSCSEDEDLNGYGDNNIAKLDISTEKTVIFQDETLSLNIDVIYGDGSIKTEDKSVNWSIEGTGSLSEANGTNTTYSSAEVDTVVITAEFDGFTAQKEVEILYKPISINLTSTTKKTIVDNKIKLSGSILYNDGRTEVEDINWSIQGAGTLSSTSGSSIFLDTDDLGTIEVVGSKYGLHEHLNVTVGNPSDVSAYFSFDDEANLFANLESLEVDAGGSYFTEGRSNGAVSLDGTQEIVIKPTEFFNPYGSYSVSFWLKTTSVDNYSLVLLDEYVEGDPDAIDWSPGDMNVYASNATFTYGDVGWGGYFYGQNNNDLTDGNWHNITLVVKQSFDDDNTANFSYYIDNLLIGSADISQEKAGNVVNDLSNKVLKIGHAWTNGNQFAGQIDDLRIIPGALSGAQVLDLYND